MNTKINLHVSLIFAFCFLSFSTQVFSKEDEDPDSFAKTYAGVEIGRNFPTAGSEEQFAPGKAHPILAYRYVLDDKWLMGIFGGFKMLQTRGVEDQSEREIPFFSVTHESSRILRLYHPTYLATGFRFMYLMPATRAMIPTGKSKDFSTEFGASATATLIHLLDRNRILTLRIERWRGTGSSTYQGIEVAVGGAISFD